MTQDTLTYNKEVMEEVYSNEMYNYFNDIPKEEFSLFEKILDFIQRLLSKININTSEERSFFIIVLMIVLLAVILFIFRKKLNLFSTDKSLEVDYTLSEEDINTIDFQTNILLAIGNKDYKLGIILQYLYSLKQLNDSGRISWQPNKTPTSYVKEVGDDNFKNMTNVYLRVRYGNYSADEQGYSEFVAWKNNIITEGVDSHEQ